MGLSASGHSFEELCLPLRGELYNHARFLMHGDQATAEDLVQETLVRALRAWSRWTPEGAEPARAARSWLISIITHKLMNLVRDERTRRRHLTERRGELLEGLHRAVTLPPSSSKKALPSDECQGSPATTNAHFESGATMAKQDIACDADIADEVVHAVDKLREPWRTFVIRRFFRRQTIAQIAAETGHKMSTVSAGICRALKRLKPLLESFAQANYGLGRAGVDASVKAAKPVQADPHRIDSVVGEGHVLPLAACQTPPHQPAAR
jgi:RNA polymerase sigma factor (sigma-70 family)